VQETGDGGRFFSRRIERNLMPNEEQKLVEPIKPFNHVLAQLEGGTLHEELSDKLHD